MSIGLITDENEDARLLARGQEILELLQRATKLGYTLELTADDARELVALFENAKLTKPQRTTEE